MNSDKLIYHNDAVAQIAGGAAIECYGIVGMASKHQIEMD